MNKVNLGIFFIIIALIVSFSNQASVFAKTDKTTQLQTKTADINPIDKAEQDCIAKTSSTFEMNKCSVNAQKAWELEITNNLSTLKTLLSDEDYMVLIKSQQIWKNYKNSEFDLISRIINNKQGTMYLNVKEGLKTDIIKQRALKLKEYIDIYND